MRELKNTWSFPVQLNIISGRVLFQPVKMSRKEEERTATGDLEKNAHWSAENKMFGSDLGIHRKEKLESSTRKNRLFDSLFGA